MNDRQRGGQAAAPGHRRLRRWFAASAIVIAVTIVPGDSARADESGTSFWLPGQMGSFAAAPSEPGWSLPLVYYHTSANSSAGNAFNIGSQVNSGLNTRVDLFIAAPTYVFSSPVAGGQAAVGVAALVGRANFGVNASFTAPASGVPSGPESDTLVGAGDLYPTASLKWNRGVHNFMAYTTAGVPVGAYQASRLAKLGVGHWSLDAGGGYTYLDEAKGHEFSAVLGFTENFKNHDTDYKSGVDGHLDWAASRFVSEQLHIGLVGYFYRQLTGDSGSGAVLGDFKSRVAAVGPQAGYFFKVGDRQWYANLKAYYEFDAKNRPEGWNVWLTLALPLGSGKK